MCCGRDAGVIPTTLIKSEKEAMRLAAEAVNISPPVDGRTYAENEKVNPQAGSTLPFLDQPCRARIDRDAIKAVPTAAGPDDGGTSK
jgi:hypothetical protein